MTKNSISCVVMFPYPSGAGLHVGHAYNYAVVDSYCRWLRYTGVEVFQPFGYDAFGLPAENYARSIGGDPESVTRANIEKFRTQMHNLDTGYQERLVTCDESYYKWTQWIFKLMLDRGLAYKKLHPVNYCTSCETVVANEQVKSERCDRCDTPVEERVLEQWFFSITKYKDRLIKNLSWVNYPEKTKKQQLHWLENQVDWCVSRQRKWGCKIPLAGETDTLDTFVDSSFYYLRYLTDSEDEFLPAGSYRPVDLYIGGNEHACMHLIYARFVHMVLYDAGYVPQEEPFDRVIHQGMITKDGEKMSKSKGNTVDIDAYDADELRFYLMFLGHYFDGGDWSDRNIVGITRFFNRFDTWTSGRNTDSTAFVDASDVEKLQANVDAYVNSFKFNKVVSTFMEFYNMNKNKHLSVEIANELRVMLACFAPKRFTARNV